MTDNNNKLIQENAGSTARDHLGHERTLLSWIRTCLTLFFLGMVLAYGYRPTSGSVTLTQLKQNYQLYLGIILSSISWLVLFVVIHRFSRIKLMLRTSTGFLKSSKLLQWIVGLVILTCTIVVCLSIVLFIKQ